MRIARVSAAESSHGKARIEFWLAVEEVDLTRVRLYNVGLQRNFFAFCEYIVQGICKQQELAKFKPSIHAHHFTATKHQLMPRGSAARRNSTDRRRSSPRRDRRYEGHDTQTSANRGNKTKTVERNIRIHKRDIDIQDSKLVAAVHGIDLDIDIARARADRLHPTRAIGQGFVGQTALPAAANTEGATLLPVLRLAVGLCGGGGGERLREDTEHAVALRGVGVIAFVDGEGDGAAA